jgi:hypothetical protein
MRARAWLLRQRRRAFASAAAPQGDGGGASGGFWGQWAREDAERRARWEEARERRAEQHAETAQEWARMRAEWASHRHYQGAEQVHQKTRVTWWCGAPLAQLLPPTLTRSRRWEDAERGQRRATPEQAAQWQVLACAAAGAASKSSTRRAWTPACMRRQGATKAVPLVAASLTASLARAQRHFADGAADDAEGSSRARTRSAAGSTRAPSDARGHYAALGLKTAESRRCTHAELHAAFRRTVLACHPDTAPEGATDSYARRFRAAVDAWELLRDERQRKRYDETSRGA